MFITFEGIDGSGKTTQIERLATWLDNFYDLEVILTAEPGGTSVGKRLRQEILHGEDISHQTELLLYLADRAEHVERVIKPALHRNAVVISDRFADSTIAYQCAGRNLDEDIVTGINKFATGDLVPDLTVLLDLEAHESRRRVENSGEKKDRLESSKIDFFERTREKFLDLARGDRFETGGRFLVLDANDDVEIISDQIEKAVNESLSRRGIEM